MEDTTSQGTTTTSKATPSATNFASGSNESAKPAHIPFAASSAGTAYKREPGVPETEYL